MTIELKLVSKLPSNSKILFKNPVVIFTDDKCFLDGKSYSEVPILLDCFGLVIQEPTDWLISQVVSGVGQLSIKQYAYFLRLYWEFLQNQEIKWDRVNDSTLRLWRNIEAGKQQVESINSRLDVVVRFYIWAQEQKYVNKLIGVTKDGQGPTPIRLVAKGKRKRPTSPQRLKATRKPRRPIPTSDDIAKLYARLSMRKYSHVAARDCLMADWALQTGMRRFEFLGLLVECIPQRSRCMEIIANDKLHYLDVTGKGGHKRNVPVLPELLLKTRDFIDEERRDLLSDSKPFKDCGLVFISQKTGGALSKEYVSRFFSAALNHGGKRKYWLHRLRARFASKLIQTLIMDSVVRSGLASLREETILFKAAEILGHKDLKSLRFYLNLSLDMLEPEIKAAMQQPKFFTKAGAQALKDQEDFG